MEWCGGTAQVCNVYKCATTEMKKKKKKTYFVPAKQVQRWDYEMGTVCMYGQMDGGMDACDSRKMLTIFNWL